MENQLRRHHLSKNRWRTSHLIFVMRVYNQFVPVHTSRNQKRNPKKIDRKSMPKEVIVQAEKTKWSLQIRIAPKQKGTLPIFCCFSSLKRQENQEKIFYVLIRRVSWLFTRQKSFSTPDEVLEHEKGHLDEKEQNKTAYLTHYVYVDIRAGHVSRSLH